MRVLRLYHSAVMSAYRERDRELRRLGCEVRLVCPLRWNEGGGDVALDRCGDDFVVPARTLGRHPYVFMYNPVPIVRELRGRAFDVIDVHEEPASLAAFEVRLLVRLLQPGVPIVFYGAQNISKRYPLPFRWIERRSLRRASGAHCCNSDAAEIFRAKGLQGVVRTIGLGVDVGRFAPATAPRRPGPMRIGYFGRLEPHKGVDVLIEAIAPLVDVELLVHGDGSAHTELVQLADRLGAGARVHFTGYVDHDEMAERYRSVDVVALPSLRTTRWVEQFGRVAVEAMASGVPVVASDTGALRDVVGGAGVLVPERDVAAWREAIRLLSGDECLRARLRDAGLVRAAQYRWSEVARSQLALYCEVAA